jgi:hypothetical protein
MIPVKYPRSNELKYEAVARFDVVYKYIPTMIIVNC